MKHVFISYKRGDNSFVRHLITQLGQAGIESWSDDQIRAGEKWREAIDMAISEAFALIVVMTPDARKSEYVTYEWAYAMGIGIAIIPILLKGDSSDNLHPKLEELNYLDFRERYGEPWKALTERLLEIQEKVSKNTIQVSKEAPTSVRNAVNSLDSSSTTVITEAIRTLAMIDHLDALKALFDALEHPNKDVRDEAFKWLFGEKLFDAIHEANSILLEKAMEFLLHTDNEDLRVSLSYRLDKMLKLNKNYALPIVLKYRTEIIKSLYREIDYPTKSRLLIWISSELTDDLLELLYWIIENEKDNKIFSQALELIGQRSPSNLIDMLAKRLKSENTQIVLTTIKKLVTLDHDKSMKLIASYIPTTEASVRGDIIDVLAEIPTKESVDLITPLLDDNEYVTVKLDGSLRSSERQISRHARLALEKINTDYAQQRLTTWRETADPKRYVDEDRELGHRHVEL